MATDPTSGNYYFADFNGWRVFVVAPDGTVLKELDNLVSARSPIYDPADSTIDVLTMQNWPTTTIVKINTKTFETTSIELPSSECSYYQTFTGGRVWFTYGQCDQMGYESIGLGFLDPLTDSLSYFPNQFDSQYPQSLASVFATTSDSNLLVTVGASLMVWDVTSGTPLVKVRLANQGGYASCTPSFYSHGMLMNLCSTVFSTVDLSLVGRLSVSDGVVSPDEDRLVGVSQNGIQIVDITGGLPGVFQRTYPLPTCSTYVFQWVTDTSFHLFRSGCQTSPASAVDLYTEADIWVHDSTATLSAPARAKFGRPIRLTGSIQPAPAGAASISVVRSDKAGNHSLADVPLATDGSFAFSDVPRASGQNTYTINYAGDDFDTPATATTTVKVNALPNDFNGDGLADLVVGSPLENVGTIDNAGTIHAIYNHAGALAGAGSVEFDQDTPGMPGTNEAGDQLGWSNASGDFNGDGYADLAVSANAEDIGSTINVGSVTVLYGSATGLTTKGSIGFSPQATKNTFFGESMAVGDFTGDGFDDLAVAAAPRESVFAYNGSDHGLDLTERTEFGKVDVAGSQENTGSLFGFSLAAGDIDGNGLDDLAIGDPYDYDDHGYSAGAVSIAYGEPDGFDNPPTQRFTEDTAGVPGSEHKFGTDRPDDFGWQVALADVNGDGKADLIASAPGYPVTTADGKKHEDAGAITELFSVNGKISTTGAKQFTQATTGIPGSPGTNDLLGNTLVAGDQNGDGKSDIAMFSPGDRWVTLVNGSSTGLSFTSSFAWNQDTPGIPGSDEPDDYWGDSLRFESFGGVGPQGLAVGAEGENSGAGALTIIYATSSGLTPTGSAYFDQNSPGIAGTAESGDWFGSFFTC